MLGRVHGVRVDRKALVVARILGARQLLQAGLSGINPSPEMLAGGVWVDAVHSLTALGLAVVDRSRARAGVTDCVVAAVWALLGWHHLSAGRAAQVAIRGRDRLARAVVGALPGGGILMRQADSTRAERERSV
ncbi:Uncharacterised protein [Mycobacterium tuberculosis]|nr:Uncharacterised protein [Mycobacterium tuberculosis]